MVWIGSNHSLRCHVTMLSWWLVSQSPPPPVAKMRVPVFAGDLACEIELRQTGVICFPWRQRSWSCSVFKSWILHTHCPFQWKWQVLHNYDISMLHQVGMFFKGFAWWRFRFCSSGSSLMSRWCNVPLVREFQMWRHRYKQRDPHWFQGRQMRFWWMWSTISWKYFIIYQSRLFSANVMIPT